MTTGLGTITDPDLRTILQALKVEISYGLNCHQVGTIQSFDPARQIATILLTVKRVVFNREQGLSSKLQLESDLVDYPLLVDCPVFTLYGGGAHITMPIAAGDTCMVMFNDRDIDNWLTSGTAQPPNSPRAHSLSDGFALVGFRHYLNPFPGYSSVDSVWSLANGFVVLRGAGDVEAISANGGRVSVKSKVSIVNATTSLKVVLDNLCTALTGWVNTGGTTPNPATVLAINNVKTLSDSLLDT